MQHGPQSNQLVLKTFQSTQLFIQFQSILKSSPWYQKESILPSNYISKEINDLIYIYKEINNHILAPGNLLADKTINKYKVDAPVEITPNHFLRSTVNDYSLHMHDVLRKALHIKLIQQPLKFDTEADGREEPVN